jgi:hypothetical protein
VSHYLQYTYLPIRWVSIGLKLTSCKLSTPHWNVLIGSLRSSSHTWQSSPHVANIGSFWWWLTPIITD